MKELADYTGEFLPRISFEDFSKDVVIKLLKALNRNCLGIDGLWFQRAIKEVGLDAAVSWSMDVWEKQCKIDMKNARQILNIKGNDVEALLKGIQFCPGFPISILEWEMELKTRNHGLITVHRCPAVDTYEREGKKGEEILNGICRVIEPPAFNSFISVVNPDIQMKELKLPPRKSKDEICCQWEFKLESKG